MKRKIKMFLIIIGIFIGLMLILVGSFVYVTEFKYTDIDMQTSPDERCQLMLQMKGEPDWPFGSTYGRIIVKYDDKILKKVKFEIHDDGAILGKENWNVVWGVAGVWVTLMGSEQNDQVLQIMYDGTIDYQFPNMQSFSQENNSSVYNDFVEKTLAESYEEKITAKENAEGRKGNLVEEKGNTELTEETIKFYLSLKPDCSYETVDGIEYRMIPADRACGSSYYVLIATADGGKSVVMVNLDPYLGSGGDARWISFLQDGQIGFSCLAYSGGTYGSLYRTEDGGRNFEEVEYPSANAILSDGTYYNPFVMPEKIYEKNGKLYMEAGQGADGDYYGEEGFCNGLYESKDNGKTWKYVKEIAVQED